MNEIRKFPLEHKLVFFYFFVVSCSFLFSKITNLSGATSFTSSVIFISMVYVVYNFFTQGKDFFIFKWRYLLYTCLQVTPALAILLIYSYPDVISLDLSTFGSSNFDFAINVFDIAFLENHSVADSQINSHNKILPFSVEPHNGRFAVFVFGSFLSGLGIHPLIAGKICLYLSLVFLTFVNAGIIRTCFQSNNIFLCHFLSALVVVSSAVLNQSMFYMILGATVSLAIFYLGLWYSFVFVFFDEKREIKTQFGLLCGISFCLYFAYQPFFLLFLAWLAGILIIRSWLKSRIRVTTFKVFSILIGVALFYSVSSYWLFVTFNRDDFSIFSEYGMGYGPLFALGILSYPLSLSLVGGEFFFEGINLVELWSIVVFSLAFDPAQPAGRRQRVKIIERAYTPPRVAAL